MIPIFIQTSLIAIPYLDSSDKIVASHVHYHMRFLPVNRKCNTIPTK
jgi:hypothetical protein